MAKAQSRHLKQKRRRKRTKRRNFTGAVCLLAGIGIVAVVAAVLANMDRAPKETTAEGDYATQKTAAEGPVAGVTADLNKSTDAPQEVAEAATGADKKPGKKKRKARQQKKEKQKQVYSFTETEEIQLQKIGLAEMEVEGIKGMALAMRVVINRVESDSFPDTVQGVIFEPKQFTPISSGSYYDMVPNEDSRKALEMVKAG